MSVTLRDVARHAGVSPRTVSNVVNDFHYVSPAMRAKVKAALNELDYTPNLVARGLKRGRTGIITLLLPKITVPYFAEIAHAVVEQASTVGATVMIDETGGAAARELELLEVAGRSGWVDGVVLSAQGLHGPALAELRTPIPVVLLGERTANSTRDHVGINNVQAATEAVNHLLAAGCRRIAAVGGHTDRPDITSRQRVQGYRAALRAAGRPAGSAQYIKTADYSRRAGALAVSDLMAGTDPPDGLFCFSDELAVGALRELHRRGICVPEQMKVVGFDDIEEAGFHTPTLTSVRPDKTEIARVAVSMLNERIQESTHPPRDVRVPYELIPRESSAGANQDPPLP